MTDIQIKIISKSIIEDFAKSIHDLHIDSLSNDVMPNFGPRVTLRYMQTLLRHNGKVILALHKKKYCGFRCA